MSNLENDLSIIGIVSQASNALVSIADNKRKVQNQTKNVLSCKESATMTSVEVNTKKNSTLPTVRNHRTNSEYEFSTKTEMDDDENTPIKSNSDSRTGQLEEEADVPDEKRVKKKIFCLKVWHHRLWHAAGVGSI